MEILIATTVGKSSLIFIFIPQYFWIYLIFNASNSCIWFEARRLFPEYKRAISICLQYFSSSFAVWAHNDGNDFSGRTCVLTKSSVEVFFSVLNYFSVCVCVCVCVCERHVYSFVYRPTTTVWSQYYRCRWFTTFGCGCAARRVPKRKS
jgi:hypothetical protein